MAINPLRVRTHSQKAYQGGTVVYQMCRELRTLDNEALLFAQELAKEHHAPLMVNYVIWNYVWEGATRRFYDWVIPSLKEVEQELRAHGIPLVVTFEDRKLFELHAARDIPPAIGAVVIEQLPLHFMNRWKDVFTEEHGNVSLYEVDAHNCVPVWEASSKQEFAAHTMRRKLHDKLPQFLEPFGTLTYHEENKELLTTLHPLVWDEIATRIVCDESVKGVSSFVPGQTAACAQVDYFLEHGLREYEMTRNDINQNGQSNLSPYLAHGNLSRRRVVLTLLEKHALRVKDAIDKVHNGSNGTRGSIASFLEELVVRAEIAENYCYYNKQYDSYEGFPEWAKVTLQKASSDRREYVYDYEAFNHAKTHDELWNAAQMQMVTTGKMHGYMRMYWAKKILEWSATPKEAMRIAVRLNDLYELDGRDPNGYVGCAWSIGGAHDRPWFGRPIFGAVRYMAESGVKKRGNIKDYIDAWVSSQGRLPL